MESYSWEASIFLCAAVILGAKFILVHFGSLASYVECNNTLEKGICKKYKIK